MRASVDLPTNTATGVVRGHTRLRPKLVFYEARAASHRDQSLPA